MQFSVRLKPKQFVKEHKVREPVARTDECLAFYKSGFMVSW